MFENIGGKIKKLAKIMTWVGIVLSCLVGLVAVVGAASSDLAAEGIIFGLVYAALGSLFSWIGSFFTYAFGELAEQSELQTRLLYQMLNCKVVPVHDVPNGTGSSVPTWKRLQMEQQSQDPQ